MDKLFLQAAKLSSLAYYDPADIESELQRTGYEDFRFVENADTDTQAFMCSLGPHVFISFRGTTIHNWDDWLTNLDFTIYKCPFGGAHSGFWGDIESVYQDILSELPRHIIHGRKLIISGHSQGAGDANCMGIKMLSEHRDVYRVIQFGGPRTVDRQAAYHIDTYFPEIFHRVVNNNDIVTRVPPRIFGYKHFGNLNYFLETGELSTDISTWERFLDRIYGKIEDFGEMHLDCLKDHMMDSEYIRLVKKNVVL